MNTNPEIAAVVAEMRAVAHPEYIRDSSVCDAINDWATRLESAKGEVQGAGLSEGECAFCGEPVNSLAGDPSRWPLTFSHPDGTGKVKHHHAGCVVTRLFSTPPESGAVNWKPVLRTLRDKLWTHPSPGVAGVSEAQRPCSWSQQDADGDCYSTGCGHEFLMIDTDPPSFPFCCFCGHPLKAVAYSEDES